MAEGLSEDDPYRNMQTGRDGVRPGFLQGREAGETEEGADSGWQPRQKRNGGGARQAGGVAEGDAGGGEQDGGLAERGGREGGPGSSREQAGEAGWTGRGRQEMNATAAQDLSAAEVAAGSRGASQREDGIAGARASERAAGGGLFTGSGKVGDGGLKAKGTKAVLKKLGPIMLAALLLLVVGVILVNVQTFMPVAIAQRLIEKFNSVGVSSTVASDKWLDKQLNSGFDTDGSNKYGVSEFQKESYENTGMYAVEDDGGGVALVYQENGQYVPVVGSNSAGVSASTVAAAAGVDESEVGAAITVDEALGRTVFKQNYAIAAKAWRGGGSGWYDDEMTEVTETKLGTTRNRWDNYVADTEAQSQGLTESFVRTASATYREQTGDYFAETVRWFPVSQCCGGENDQCVLYPGEFRPGDLFVPDDGEDANVRKTPGKWFMLNGTDKHGREMTVTRMENTYYYLPDGTKVWDGRYVYGDNNNTLTDTETVDLEAQMTQKSVRGGSSTKAARAAAGASSDETCEKVEAMMSVYTVVNSYQTLQYLNLASGYLEAVDKMKAGEGTESPVHEYSNILVTKQDTVQINDDGSETVVREDRSAMESDGMAWLFNNEEIDPQDASVRNVNFEGSMTKTLGDSGGLGGVTGATQAYNQCGYVEVQADTGNLTVTGMEYSPIQGGESKFTQVAETTTAEIPISSAAQSLTSNTITSTAKKAALVMQQDVATEWKGENFGNALISGASKYISSNGASGGQGAGTRSKVVSYLGAQEAVIADWAEVERATLSPFDTSSPYTFFGSIMYSLIPLAYTSGGVIETTAKVASIASEAVVAMSPVATAESVNADLTSEGDCPLVEEGAGGVGEAYCNSYIITDMGTINDDPDYVYSQIQTDSSGRNNFNSDGSINEEADLGKYAIYCGQRTSQYGLKDSRIVDDLSSNTNQSWWQRLLQKLKSLVPWLTQSQTVLGTLKSNDELQWATGEACTASDDNPYWNGTISNNKYYARYMENERLVENMNLNYNSPVTSYVKEYYVQNPVDNSLEGQIARFSGMSLEKVTDTLALIEYYQFLNEYDASTRYAFGAPKVVMEQPLYFESASVVAAEFYDKWWGEKVYGGVYGDLRRQNFVV